jgi:hypothetical protein
MKNLHGRPSRRRVFLAPFAWTASYFTAPQERHPAAPRSAVDEAGSRDSISVGIRSIAVPTSTHIYWPRLVRGFY